MKRLRYSRNSLFKLKSLLALLLILGVSACGVRNTPATPAIPNVEPSAINTIEKRISNGVDDVEEVASGYVTATSERLEFTKTDENGNQLVGLRFRDIDIPEDATITNAQLFFTAARSTSALTRVTVEGIKDAKAFPTTENYLSNADTTQASNAWPPNAWTEVGALDKYRTGNISNIVQELVDADDWRSGNALAFVISGEGDRSAESFEGNPEQAPRLVIEYDSSDPGTNPEPNTGADYYVSTEEGSDSNSGTLEEPLKTVNEAVSRVQPGDVIQIRGGVYKEYVRGFEVSGTTTGQPGDPVTDETRITIEGYPGEEAILDGSNGTGSTTALFRIQGQDGFLIQNLTFRDGNDRGLDIRSDDGIGGDNNIVRDVIAYDNGDDGVYIRGENNLLEDIISYGNWGFKNPNIQEATSGDGIKFAGGGSNTIRDCVTYLNGDDGVDTFSSPNATVKNCVSYRNGYQLEDGEFVEACFTNNDGERDCGDGNGYKMGAAVNDENGNPILGRENMKNTNNVYVNNVAFDNRAISFYANGAGGMFICNNSSWGGKNLGFAVGTGGIRAKKAMRNVVNSNLSFGEQTGGFAGKDKENNNAFDLTDSPYVDGDGLDPDSPDFLKLKPNFPRDLEGIGADSGELEDQVKQCREQ